MAGSAGNPVTQVRVCSLESEEALWWWFRSERQDEGSSSETAVLNTVLLQQRRKLGSVRPADRLLNQLQVRYRSLYFA